MENITAIWCSGGSLTKYKGIKGKIIKYPSANKKPKIWTNRVPERLLLVIRSANNWTKYCNGNSNFLIKNLLSLVALILKVIISGIPHNKIKYSHNK